MIKIIKNITLFSIIFLSSVVILDRFIYYSGSETVSVYGYDNKIGRTLLPDVDYLYTSEGMGMGTTNKYGYLGKPSNEPGSDTKIRIALIGDSYVEAYQLFDRQYFGRSMEKTLQQKYGIDADVMNFGRSGFMLSDMYSYYENFIKQFQPDVVLFFVDNDDFAGINKENGMPYPYVENDSLKIFYYPESKSNTFILFSMSQMSKYSPVFQMIRNSVNLNNEGQTPGIIFGKFYEIFSSKKVESETKSFTLDSTFSKILNKLTQNENNYIVFRDKLGINDEINSLVKKLGVKHIDINDTLKIVEANGFDPYFWKSTGRDGHWNIKAHELIGDYLAGRISKDIK